MPDFEQLTDQLRVDLSRTKEEASYWMGYNKGKDAARIQVVVVVAFFALAYLGWLYFK